jgi:nucleoside phosphorylase
VLDAPPVAEPPDAPAVGAPLDAPPVAEPLDARAVGALLDALRRRGLRAHAGTVFSTDHLTRPDERARLAVEGVAAVDMESAWLAGAAAGRPLAVVRVVVEPAGRRLADPRTLVAGTRALANLRRAAAALDEWAGAAAAFDGPPGEADMVPFMGMPDERSRA